MKSWAKNKAHLVTLSFSLLDFSVHIHSLLLREGYVYLLEELQPLIRIAQLVIANVVAALRTCHEYLLQAH